MRCWLCSSSPSPPVLSSLATLLPHVALRLLETTAAYNTVVRRCPHRNKGLGPARERGKTGGWRVDRCFFQSNGILLYAIRSKRYACQGRAHGAISVREAMATLRHAASVVACKVYSRSKTPRGNCMNDDDELPRHPEPIDNSVAS